MAEKMKVALLTIPESSGSLVYGMYDLFASVRRDWAALVRGEREESPFWVRIVGRRPGRLQVANGLHVEVQEPLTWQADIVCIPEVLVAPDEDITSRYEPELEYLRASHARGAILAAACTGALLLAEAGLLHGQQATTHWLYCSRLAAYPEVTVHAKKSLVISGEGQLVMAGGGTAFQDLCLYLIARNVGVEEAVRTARLSLIDWHAGGQQPYVELSAGRQTEDATIARCQVWLAQHYTTPSPVADLIQVSGLPERSLHRRFKQATGMSPIEYTHAVRLEEAKQMLETTEHSVECIAGEVGYEDASFFGRLFKRQVGLTPAQYRRRFAGLRQHLRGALSG